MPGCKFTVADFLTQNTKKGIQWTHKSSGAIGYGDTSVEAIESLTETKEFKTWLTTEVARKLKNRKSKRQSKPGFRR